MLIPCLNVWRLITPEKWEEFHPGFGTKALGHGGDPLTSVYLHLFADLMRMDLIDLEADKGEMIGSSIYYIWIDICIMDYLGEVFF